MQVEDIKEYSTKIKRTEEEIAKGIIGQRNVIHHILLAILADGNVLLEGVPGLGKTQLVKTLAKVMDLNFSRIQFTPDLMPTDITGTNLIIKEGDRNRFPRGLADRLRLCALPDRGRRGARGRDDLGAHPVSPGADRAHGRGHGGLPARNGAPLQRDGPRVPRGCLPR